VEWLASFSNWESKLSSRTEYEMMAPGVQIYSTLPEGKYAAWNGTSMAAPVVAGVAALVRTKFPEKKYLFFEIHHGASGGNGSFQVWKVLF
jgi:subtilisin family serine protease